VKPIAWIRISTPPLDTSLATVQGAGGWRVSLPSETSTIVRDPVVPRSLAACRNA
jgi:hypothetical protein